MTHSTESGVTPASTQLAPYDGVVLVSFGGPERAEDVVPFLRRVTAGRGIPDERLAVVGQHYYTLGGRSPVNDQGRALQRALAEELAAKGCPLPVGFGNRNWAPELVDALRGLHDAGARRVVAVLTSAYPSYSSCRQYRENLADALAVLRAEGVDLQVDLTRPYWNHPAFADAMVERVTAAVAATRPEECATTRLVHVTHSIPTAMAHNSGRPNEPEAYVRAHEALVEHVSQQVAARTGIRLPADLVYCSRSGRPQDPWLEPDVNDHLEALAAAGVTGVVVVPLGFLSDHIEVVWDLDHEARATADRLGLRFERVPTVGTDRGFVAGLVDLLAERAAQARGEHPDRPVVTASPRAAGCAPDCCAPTRRTRAADAPAALGE